MNSMHNIFYIVDCRCAYVFARHHRDDFFFVLSLLLPHILFIRIHFYRQLKHRQTSWSNICTTFRIHLNAILNCMPAALWTETASEQKKRIKRNKAKIKRKKKTQWNLSTAAVAATGCRLLLLFRWFEMRLSGCMCMCVCVHDVEVRACISNTHHPIRICSSAT